MLGRHTIKHWSSTQPNVALSSGEAEFYGVVRGAGHGLGYQALLADLGIAVPLRVWTDSSAALGICSRQGLGKLRHLDTHTLWVQQAVRSRRIELKKVPGQENPADLLTKHSLTRERVEGFTKLYHCYFRDGRADSAPAMRIGETQKQTIAKAARTETMNSLGRQDPTTTSATATTASATATTASAPATYTNLSTGVPRMPHNVLSRADLDREYPSLEAVNDLELDDLTRLEDDQLYAAGMRVVQTMLHEMSVVGRSRRAGTEGLS